MPERMLPFLHSQRTLVLLLHLLLAYVGYFHDTLSLKPLFCSATPQTPLLPLRTAVLNGSFDTFWQDRSHALT